MRIRKCSAMRCRRTWVRASSSPSGVKASFRSWLTTRPSRSSRFTASDTDARLTPIHSARRACTVGIPSSSIS